MAMSYDNFDEYRLQTLIANETIDASNYMCPSRYCFISMIIYQYVKTYIEDCTACFS